MIGDEDFEELPWEAPDDEESAFGNWLKGEMKNQGLGISDLVTRTGITYTGIRNIIVGRTKTPRQETRTKLASALNSSVPESVQQDIESDVAAIPGLSWSDFTPSDLQTVPQLGGVYVFYDVTDRPVYVGMSKANVRQRVKDHQTRFWFKQPLVVRGSFLAIQDPALCVQIESILIKFLGKHALLNVKGATKDFED